jgi:integrase
MSAGLGSIYKRGGVYWISWYYRGERFRESSKSTRRKDAEALLRKRVGDVGKGRTTGPDPEKVTFEDLAEMIQTDYKVHGRKATRRLRSSLKHLREHLGILRALDITTDRVRTYIGDRQDEGAATATIQKECAALKRMFRLAKQAERLPHIPHVPVPQVRNTRTHFLSREDVERVCSFLSADLAAVVRFALLTGWRKGEVLSLRWGDVDFAVGTVHLKPGTTKNDAGRTFPMRALPELEALLRERLDRTRALERERGEIIPHVFHRDGEPILSMREAWNNAARLAGIPGAWFHDLRRSAVRNLERAGVSRSVAMKLTGHKTESVYRRYAIADEEVLAEGVEKLAKLHGERGRERQTVLPIERSKEA